MRSFIKKHGLVKGYGKGVWQRHVSRETRKRRNVMLRVAVEGLHIKNDVALLFEQISCFVSRADKNRRVQQQ